MDVRALAEGSAVATLVLSIVAVAALVVIAVALVRIATRRNTPPRD